jgi:hypothetical protein
MPLAPPKVTVPVTVTIPSPVPAGQNIRLANDRLQHRVTHLEAKLSVALQRIDDLERHTSLKRKHFEVSDSEIGILNYLRLTQVSLFDRRFVCSQSSAELFGIMNPNIENYYGSPDKGDAWVQFEFKKEITILSFLIQSYLSCFIKSYRMVAIGPDFAETVLYSTTSEDGLNGQLKQVIHDLDRPIKTKIVRFEQTGKSWTDKNFIGIKRLDFRTDQCQGFYFEHLLKFVGGDHHKIPVNLTSHYFDVYAFVNMNPNSYICTFDDPTPSWFHIEFVQGRAAIAGYRLKRHEALKLKAWSLRGSNDPTLELERWKVLHRVDETKENPVFGLYHCDLSEPYKYVRIVMDGPSWNDRTYLAFWHFELFGDYVTD